MEEGKGPGTRGHCSGSLSAYFPASTMHVARRALSMACLLVFGRPSPTGNSNNGIA